MAHEHITSQIVAIRPVEAAHLVGTTLLPTQRPLRMVFVETLVHEIRHGAFRPGTQIVFAVLPEGKRYLLDGQHRLHAVMLADTPVVFDVQTIAVATLAEAEKLYGVFDCGIPRSITDGFLAERLHERVGLGREKLHKLNAALSVLVVGFTGSQPSPGAYNTVLRSRHFRHEAIASWSPEAQAFFDGLAGGPQHLWKRLAIAGVMSVGLVTYRYAPQNAERFWPAVAHDDGLTAESPLKLLLHFLLDVKSRRLPSWETARYVAGAWNSFALERRVRQLHPAGLKSEAIVIEGTPHKGKKLRYIAADGSLLRDPIPAP